MNKSNWTNAAFITLDAPTTFPTHTREDPTEGGFSDLLYAWDEAKQAAAAKRAAKRGAKARIGVRAFSWEAGDAGEGQ